MVMKQNKESMMPHVDRWCNAKIVTEEASFVWKGVLVSVSEDAATYQSKDGSLNTFLLSQHREINSQEKK